MRILLHIGMPKAGSSALQKGLLANAPALAAKGVLYSAGGFPKHKASALIAGVRGGRNLPRSMVTRHGRTDELALQDYRDWLDALQRDVERFRPHTLVISNESLFKVTEPEQFGVLSALLNRLGTASTVVAYLRRPSDWYYPAAQQTLKASSRCRTLRPPEYRHVLEGYARHVTEDVRPFAYDRTDWPGGDILRHFAETFFADAAGAIRPAERSFNPSLTPEATEILREYRKLHHANADGVFTRDTQQLLKHLRGLDARHPRDDRVRLLPEVAARLDHGCPDLLWLRDRHGVSFASVDYEAVGSGTPAGTRPGSLFDVVQMDRARYERLRESLARHLDKGPSARDLADRPRLTEPLKPD